VANTLNNDGICLLENVGLEVSPPGFQEWTLTRDGIEIKTRFEVKEKDAIRQITRGILTLEVNDKGERKELSLSRSLKILRRKNSGRSWN
jgi:hypothetical protein